MSVGFICKSVSIFPCESLTRKSKKGILPVLGSCVNFILGWNWLRFSKNVLSLSSPWGQVKKISSIYRSHVKDLYFCFFKNSPSMQAYVGAHLLRMAVTEICCLIWPLNSRRSCFLIQTLSFELILQ